MCEGEKTNHRLGCVMTHARHSERSTILLILAVLVFLVGCASGQDEDSGPDGDGSETPACDCTSDAECPAGMTCDGCRCRSLVDGDECECSVDWDCDAGLHCVDCRCVANVDGDGDGEAEEESLPDGDAEIDDDRTETDDDRPEGAVIEVPEVLEFPPLAVGDSTEMLLTISSVGRESLEIESVGLSAESSGDFSIDTQTFFPAMIASGGSLSVNIVYEQTDMGLDSGAVVVVSNDPATAEARVALRSVERGDPSLRCEQTSVDFGLADVDGGRNVRQLVCHNDRQNAEDLNILNITSLRIDPSETTEFRIGEETPAQVFIPSGESASIDLEFLPETEGSRGAALQIFHNADGVASPLEITLSGIGGGRHAELLPESLEFGTVRIGTGERRRVTFKASGDFPVTLTALEAAPECTSDFHIEDDGLLAGGDYTVQAGGQAAFNVLFAPTRYAFQECSIRVTSDAVEGPVLSVAASGAGTAVEMTADPVALSFGAVEIGGQAELSVAISNDGEENLSIAGVRFADPAGFSLEGQGAPFGLEPDATLTYTVTFTPLLEASYETALIFDIDHDGDSEFHIPVSGTGAVARLERLPAETLVDFGEGMTGHAEAISHTLRSDGLVPLFFTDPDWSAIDGDPNNAIQADFLSGATELAPGESGELRFTFSPPAPEFIVGDLPLPAERIFTFGSNDPDQAEVSITVRGTIVDPHAITNPEGPVFDFGNQVPGYAAAPIEVELKNGGSGTLVVNDIHLTLDSDNEFSLDGLPEFPMMLAGPGGEGDAQAIFTLRFFPETYGPFEATLRIVNEGYRDENLTIQILGAGSNCASGTHNCNGDCVANDDVAHCGNRCTPCTPPANASAVCAPLSEDTFVCDFECNEPFQTFVDHCIPPNDPDCCGADCLDCTANLPELSTGFCDDGACDFECDPMFHKEGALCLLNDSVDCCGVFCLACPRRDNAVRTCNDFQCGYDCEDNTDNCNHYDPDGCEAPLLTDEFNCGACGTRCQSSTGSTICWEGECHMQFCNGDLEDCNGDFSDGCEVDTDSDRNHCGDCEHACPDVPNASIRCKNGECDIASCDFGYEDCNGTYADGCERHLLSDVETCGSCEESCAFDDGIPVCINGICRLQACEDDFGNCDGLEMNGCETSLLNHPDHCGLCGAVCRNANGTSGCENGVCNVSDCTDDRRDCNGNPEDGCEADVRTDVSHCGTCGNPCTADHADPICTARTCGFGACHFGYADCNYFLGDDCETDILANPDHCGGCNRPCRNAANMHGAACQNGVCQPGACDTGWGDCNDDLSDGCEEELNSPDHCGSCDNACDLDNAVNVCVDGNCEILFCEQPYENCNLLDSDGCETYLPGDPMNCNTCNMPCNLPHTDVHACLQGECYVDTCDAGWGDCNGESEDGCEQDLLNDDPDRCGACDGVCNLDYTSTHECVNGACRVDACTYGHADCNGLDVDGCEVDLTTVSNSCATAQRMYNSGGGGSIQGDDGSEHTNTYTGHGERWFLVTVDEDSNSCTAVSVLISLDVAEGTDYDLYLYSDCGTYLGKGVAVGDDAVIVCSDDTWFGSDNGFDVYIHVTYYSANVCADWSLVAQGNVDSDCGCFRE